MSLLKTNRNFRHLFFGQLVSQLGSFITITVVPIQVYQLTHSSAMVGLVSVVELIPMLFAAFLGGVFADRLDRKKLLVVCECAMSIGVMLLLFNSLAQKSSLALIFIVSGILQAVNGFHRPSMDSLVQAILLPEEIPLSSALNSLRGGIVMLAGPSLGGILISFSNAAVAYSVDLFTFVFSVVVLFSLKTSHLKRVKQKLHLVSSLLEGFRYAWSRQEILGTYVVDLVALTFAFPAALFPAMSESWGHPEAAGFMFSSLTLGSLVIPFFSGWASRVRRRGLLIIISALFWGLGILFFGMASQLWVALICLVFAGFADTMSGLFRSMIWNQTIPNQLRGRMAGFEMISYMSGPLLGNARAGWVASATSDQFSLISGGVSCVLLVTVVAFLLPQFRDYDAFRKTPPKM